MSGKTSLISTITDIHFLSVYESCTHAEPRNTKNLIIDGQVCFYRRLFWRCFRTTRMYFMALEGINSIVWGTKLQTAVLASPKDCISLCPILKAQHCSLSPNGRFNQPTAPHLPTPYRLNQ